MSEFVVRLESEHPPAVAWARIWDLERHTATIPLTRVALDAPAVELAEGAGFTGRTALGPLGFDDTMRVAQWRPATQDEGGVAVVDKTGRLLGGRIEVEVTPSGVGSEVIWRQRVRLPWLPAVLRPLESLAALAAAPGYRLVLRRLLA